MPQIEGYDAARKAVQANTSPRAQELDEWEAWVECRQYAGRPDWFTEGTPLWERAPCIRYPIAKTAIASFVDLVLGEGRYPELTSHPGEDDTDFAPTALSDDDSKLLDRFVAELEKQSKFRKAARELMAHAMGTGSAVAILGVKRGRVFVESTKAKWCTPEVDLDGNVTELVIEYPFIEQSRDDKGRWRAVAKLYRRKIDAQRDVTYVPLKAREDGVPPKPSEWQEDPKQAFDHALGFCPVRWYAYLKGCSTIGQIDGTPIHEGCLDKIQGFDFALSQKHRAALFCGDPQLIETGVERGYNPSEAGRTASVPATRDGGAATRPEGKNPVVGRFMAEGAGGLKKARKKSPGVAWQYEDPQTKAAYLILPPDALKAIDEHCHDLRQKIAETLSVVFMDPENVKFAATVSGKALETLRARQLDRCDQIRDDFGDGFILPAWDMVLRIVATVKGSLSIAGAEKGVALLQKFRQASEPTLEGAQPGEWLSPMLSLKWGPYFRPDPTDQQVVVALAQQAKDAGLVTERIAIEKIAPIFNIQNVDQVIDALEEERSKKQDEQMTLEHALSQIANTGENASAAAPGGGKKPPPNRSRGGAVPAVASEA